MKMKLFYQTKHFVTRKSICAYTGTFSEQKASLTAKFHFLPTNEIKKKCKGRYSTLEQFCTKFFLIFEKSKHRTFEKVYVYMGFVMALTT